jgi:hypothetical protein
MNDISMCISTTEERRIRRQTFCTSALYSQRLLYQRHLALFFLSAEELLRPFCQQYQAKQKTHRPPTNNMRPKSFSCNLFLADQIVP